MHYFQIFISYIYFSLKVFYSQSVYFPLPLKHNFIFKNINYLQKIFYISQSFVFSFLLIMIMLWRFVVFAVNINRSRCNIFFFLWLLLSCLKFFHTLMKLYIFWLLFLLKLVQFNLYLKTFNKLRFSVGICSIVIKNYTLLLVTLFIK